MHPFPRVLQGCLAAGALLLAWPGPTAAFAQAPGPAPAAPAAPAAKTFIYKLTPSDRIRIMVYGEPDLSTIARIDANGNVNLYLVGDVHVAGSTVNDAQRLVETAYHDGRFLRNPKVTISVEDYAPRTVTVDGQVKNPGPISLPAEATLTVYQAIIRAGGFTDVAKGSAVSVTRVMPDGTKKVFTVDVDSLIKGKDRSKTEDTSLQLEPGDIIYVPERLI
ncbi:MAG TPA: polysaccharide biosynthesis/export family protein [Opitutaceae bacterium]|nr:polysaccharide biosynthesis/export family protein [Opitutaceae bacterium]